MILIQLIWYGNMEEKNLKINPTAKQEAADAAKLPWERISPEVIIDTILKVVDSIVPKVIKNQVDWLLQLVFI